MFSFVITSNTFSRILYHRYVVFIQNSLQFIQPHRMPKSMHRHACCNTSTCVFINCKIFLGSSTLFVSQSLHLSLSSSLCLFVSPSLSLSVPQSLSHSLTFSHLHV